VTDRSRIPVSITIININKGSGGNSNCCKHPMAPPEDYPTRLGVGITMTLAPHQWYLLGNFHDAQNEKG